MILFTNAHIYQHPQAEAILCRDGWIQAVGKAAEFQADTVIDLQGGTVYPGFTDSHLHLLGLGQSLERLNLVGTASAQAVVQQVAAACAAAAPGTWIQGRGWDQNDWPVTNYPDKHQLDAVAPDRPVYLRRIDGHAAWVNSLVLVLAGITAATPDPPGGLIRRDAAGNPTGILIDKALELVERVVPKPGREDRERQLLKASRFLNSLGLTAVHDAGTDLETLSLLKELIARERLTLRVYALLDDPPDSGSAEPVWEPGSPGSWLKLRAVKLYLDGALGSRGAALLEPYSDDPGHSGLLVNDSAAIAAKVQHYNSRGIQVGIHCIGDRANRMALDIFEQVGDPRCRNRIEHAQIIHPADIPRFARLGVIPSMQPTHCTSDMPWVPERLGPARLPEAYPWRTLVSCGAIIPGGSDAPVEHPDPRAGIYAALTRQDSAGRPAGGWQPEERLTRRQALQMFTEWAAYAAFEEYSRGKIEAEYLADFTVLAGDLERLEPPDILTTPVQFTIVNGRVVYSR